MILLVEGCLALTSLKVYQGENTKVITNVYPARIRSVTRSPTAQNDRQRFASKAGSIVTLSITYFKTVVCISDAEKQAANLRISSGEDVFDNAENKPYILRMRRGE